MDIASEFKDIRRVSTPFVLCSSPDYRATVAALSTVRVNGESEPPLVMWDCIRGHYGLNKLGKAAAGQMGNGDETVQAPAGCLKAALNLPEQSILFMVFPRADTLLEPAVAQGIANLRDEFKRDRRTLVILGTRDLKAPPLVAEDMPALREDLPSDDEIRSVAESVYSAAGVKLNQKEVSQAIPLCRGLTRFAVEEGFSRRLRRVGLDLKGLADMQRVVVEQTTDRALVFEREPWTFDDVGGLAQLRKFMGMLFSGRQRPQLIVRIDEMDKSVSAASQGSVADNTGIAQNQLSELLINLEDNGWFGSLLVGVSGTGKTLASICTGNTFGVTTLAMNLGAMKSSLAGASEQNIRTAMSVIKAIGGKNVFFFATVNEVDTIPAALQSRFSFGSWFFDVPNRAAKDVIWKIQTKAHSIKMDGQKIPNDEHWVGRNVRDCCRIADRCSVPLVDAAEMVTGAGKSGEADVRRYREMAENRGWLSVDYPGPYRKTEERRGARSLSL